MAAITDLATLTAIASDDWFVVNDVSAGSDKKITQSDMLGGSGTWTPDLTFGGSSTGITYSSRNGYYARAGSIVFVQGVFILTSKGSATGNASIGNLPFTSAASGQAWLTVAWQNMTSSYVNMIGFVNNSSASISIRGITAAATTNLTTVTDTGFSNTSILYMSGVYRA